MEVDRRSLLLGLCAAALPSASALSQTSRHPAIVYMHSVAKDLFKAQNEGTIPAYFKAISKHADVPSIGLYALGQYQSDLPKSDYERYYRGVTTFMSRYFADQTRKYRVAKAEFDEEPFENNGDTMVRTKITLLSGSVYRVVFRLAHKGAGYKISDVKVLGFSLSYLQRGIFQSYLAKKKGDVSALVAALNR